MRDQLLVEREKTHGDFKVTSSISQQIKAAFDQYDDALVEVQREALDMIAVKIARILAGDPNYKEHWLDIAGYAELGLEACRSSEAVLTDKES